MFPLNHFVFYNLSHTQGKVISVWNNSRVPPFPNVFIDDDTMGHVTVAFMYIHNGHLRFGGQSRSDHLNSEASLSLTTHDSPPPLFSFLSMMTCSRVRPLKEWESVEKLDAIYRKWLMGSFCSTHIASLSHHHLLFFSGSNLALSSSFWK